MNKKQNGITMKLENMGKRKDKTIMVYGLPRFENRKELSELFNGVLARGIKTGQRVEAWKLYDTPNSYRFAKQINDSILHFQVC